MKEPRAIDWKELHRRMETSRAVCEDTGRSRRENVGEILKKRAKQLAAEPSQEKDGDSLEVIEFLLAHERYGMSSSHVREVFPLKDYTPVPGTPAFIIGVINVRSRVVSVTDIRRFFD